MSSLVYYLMAKTLSPFNIRIINGYNAHNATLYIIKNYIINEFIFLFTFSIQFLFDNDNAQF